MTDLTKMWAALEKYQPYADEDGHGKSWKRMCAERTQKAADAAARAAAWVADDAAADAAWAADAAYAEGAAYWSALAVKQIEATIKERETVASPQHSEIEQLRVERDALKVEVARLKSVCYDLTGQLMVLRATKQMTAAIDAARSDK